MTRFDDSSSTILPSFNHFWGQMPIFSWVTPTFFSLTRFFIGFVITSEKINRRCRWKNGHLIPKTSIIQGFWGQMPIFSWVTPTFLSMSRFVIEFGLLWTILDQFGPFLVNVGCYFDLYLNIKEPTEAVSQRHQRHRIQSETYLGCQKNV